MLIDVDSILTKSGLLLDQPAIGRLLDKKAAPANYAVLISNDTSTHGIPDDSIKTIWVVPRKGHAALTGFLVGFVVDAAFYIVVWPGINF